MLQAVLQFTFCFLFFFCVIIMDWFTLLQTCCRLMLDNTWAALQIRDRSPETRPVASLNQSQTQLTRSVATGLGMQRAPGTTLLYMYLFLSNIPTFYRYRRSAIGRSLLPHPGSGTTCHIPSPHRPPSLAIFRRQLKTHLYSQSYRNWL